MSAYAVPYPVRITCIFFLLAAVCGSGVILVAEVYLQTGLKRLLWVISRGFLLAGLCLLCAELAQCQLYLWEGTMLPSPASIRLSFIPGVILTVCCWFIFGEKIRSKVLSVILVVAYLFYMLPQPWFWLAGLCLTVTAAFESGYCLYYVFHDYQGATVSYILTQLSDNIPHGLALYGRRGNIIEQNTAFEAFCCDCSLTRANLQKLCSTLGVAVSFEGKISYTCDRQHYEVIMENLPNRKKAVFIQNTTAFMEALESERKTMLRLVEQSRITEDLIKQQEQTELLQDRKNALHELHDNAGQMLAIISMSLDLLLNEGTDGNAGEDLDKIKSLLDNYMKNNRSNMYSPLKESLEKLKHTYEVFGIEILETQTAPPLLQEEEEAISAICHEAVLNAIRHAKANRVEITWLPEVHNLVRIVNKTAASDAFVSGIGIASMTARAKRVGMKLKAEIRDGCFLVSVIKESHTS